MFARLIYLKITCNWSVMGYNLVDDFNDLELLILEYIWKAFNIEHFTFSNSIDYFCTYFSNSSLSFNASYTRAKGFKVCQANSFTCFCNHAWLWLNHLTTTLVAKVQLWPITWYCIRHWRDTPGAGKWLYASKELWCLLKEIFLTQ